MRSRSAARGGSGCSAGSMDWLSIAIGGGITLSASWLFYILAARDLRREAADLRRLNIALIHLLNNAGVVEVEEFDPLTGIPLRWSVVGEVAARWNVEAAPEDARDEDEGGEDR